MNMILSLSFFFHFMLPVMLVIQYKGCGEKIGAAGQTQKLSHSAAFGYK